MALGDMSHEDLSTVAAATGDMKLLSQCIAVSALDLVHEMQNAPASVPERIEAFFHSLAPSKAAGLPELTPTEGGQ